MGFGYPLGAPSGYSLSFLLKWPRGDDFGCKWVILHPERKKAEKGPQSAFWAPISTLSEFFVFDAKSRSFEELTLASQCKNTENAPAREN